MLTRGVLAPRSKAKVHTGARGRQPQPVFSRAEDVLTVVCKDTAGCVTHLYTHNMAGLVICIYVCMVSCFSRVRLFATLWTVAHQAPQAMGFSRQEYWNGLPCPAPGHLPDPWIEPASPTSPALQADSSLLSHQGKPICIHIHIQYGISISCITVKDSDRALHTPPWRVSSLHPGSTHTHWHLLPFSCGFSLPTVGQVQSVRESKAPGASFSHD